VLGETDRKELHNLDIYCISFKVRNSTVMTWWCLERVVSMIDEHTHLAGKPAVQRPFGRHRCKWKNAIETP
jgi:hypothetical protein